MRYFIVALLALVVPKLASANDRARITKEAATQTALARVPGGVVTSTELEREHGKLIYSFDITRDKRVIEVHVDAHTGAVIAVENE